MQISMGYDIIENENRVTGKKFKFRNFLGFFN
jgi:hypothetical protein